MQWHNDILILGVFAGHEQMNAWIYFRNSIGVVGWRQVQPNSPDGCSNVLQVAIAAQQSGRNVSCLVTNAGEIVAIQTI
ncbi:MAG: hypothetical protein JWP37_3668 [Mucilaginibacter sp.]|nr:hypothetical protein [Mucilaginibacter sp.]